MANVQNILFVLYAIFQQYGNHATFPSNQMKQQPLWSYTYCDKLRKDLLHNYDRHSRPSQPFDTTTVNISLIIKHVEIDELRSIFTMVAWIPVVWYDDKLQWNPEDYGGMSEVNIADHELWLPDIHVYNSPAETIAIQSSNIYAVVQSDGGVLWVPQIQVNSFCTLDLKYWPFDTQHCDIIFGSWATTGDAIDMEVGNVGIELELLVNSSEWQITNKLMRKHVQYYNCCVEPYPEIIAELTLKRVSNFYSRFIFIPAFVIVIFTLGNFWLPTHTNEKIVVNVCTLVTVALLILYFIQKVPPVSTNTPATISFYSSCLYVLVFSLMESIIVIWLTRTKHNSSLPWFVKKFINGVFACHLRLNICIQSKTSHGVEEMCAQLTELEEYRDTGHIIKEFDNSSVQQDWVSLAMAIDKLGFYFFTFLFIILAIIYST